MFDRLKQAANITKFKADQLLRVQSVQNEIGGINQQLNAIKDRIANAVIDLHKRGAIQVPELDELIGSADGLMAQIAQKEAQIAAIKAEVGPQAAPPQPQPGFQQQGGYPQQPQGGYPPCGGLSSPAGGSHAELSPAASRDQGLPELPDGDPRGGHVLHDLRLFLPGGPAPAGGSAQGYPDLPELPV